MINWPWKKPQPEPEPRVIVTVDGFVVLDCSVEHLLYISDLTLNPVVYENRGIKIQVVKP